MDGTSAATESHYTGARRIYTALNILVHRLSSLILPCRALSDDAAASGLMTAVTPDSPSIELMSLRKLIL